MSNDLLDINRWNPKSKTFNQVNNRRLGKTKKEKIMVDNNLKGKV